MHLPEGRSGDSRVVGKGGIERPSAAVVGSAHQRLQRANLERREASVRLRPFAGQHCGIEAAGAEVVDHPVFEAILAVASAQHLIPDEPQVGIRECAADDGLAVRPLGRGAGEDDLVPDLIHVGPREAEARIARDDPVEFKRQTFGGDQGLAPAVAAAQEIGAVRLSAVEGLDQGLGRPGGLLDGAVGVVDAGLLIDGEARVHQGRPSVPAVRRDDSKALLQSCRADPARHRAQGRVQDPVQASAAFKHEPPVPVRGETQLKSYPQPLACLGGSPRDHGLEQAVFRQL